MFRMFRLWRVAGQDLSLLWFALRHPNRPVWLLPIAALLGLYALEPANFAMPVIGFVDDLVLLPLMLHWVVKFLPSNIRSGFGSRACSVKRA